MIFSLAMMTPVDPMAAVALHLSLILLVAKLGGDLARRVGQPAVLGELVAGVLLGNLGLLGGTALGAFVGDLRSDGAVDLLARLGVLILLFEVGLGSTLAQMWKVGRSALLVALLGVAAPFVLGFLVGEWLLPASGGYAHAFLGATLSATSVGITARVLGDLGEARSDVARVILGAAVIDDVLGLLLLAVVGGAVSAAGAGRTESAGEVLLIVGKALSFLVAAVGIGVLGLRRLFPLASRLRARGVLLALGLIVCFFYAWAAGAVGLAPIVGAFAAGLVLEEGLYREFVAAGEQPLDSLVAPIASFLVPIFFVGMGLRTELAAFADPKVWALAGALTVAAIAGKQACALGVLERDVDRVAVGLGMIPRGEVGLIFANLGLTLTLDGKPLVDGATFSAIVVMVIATTVLTPPALAWRLGKSAAS